MPCGGSRPSARKVDRFTCNQRRAPRGSALLCFKGVFVLAETGYWDPLATSGLASEFRLLRLVASSFEQPDLARNVHPPES